MNDRYCSKCNECGPHKDNLGFVEFRKYEYDVPSGYLPSFFSIRPSEVIRVVEHAPRLANGNLYQKASPRHVTLHVGGYNGGCQFSTVESYCNVMRKLGRE